MGLQGHVLPTTGAMKSAAAAQPAPAPKTAEAPKTEGAKVETPAVESTETKEVKQSKPAKSEKKDTTPEQAEKLVEKAEEAEAPAEQLFDVVINGKQRQVTKDQLIRMAQKGEAADDKFDKASKMHKQAEQILEYFKKDPKKALQELGHDVRSMAEQFLADELKKEMMSPEQREALEWKQKAEEYEKILKAGEEKAKNERAALEKARFAKKYDEELTSAIETAGLIKDPAIVKNVARIMHDYLEKGYEISASDAVKEFQDSVLSQASTLIKLVGPQRATQMLGEDFMNAIRKEDLKKIKNPLTPSGDNGQFGTRDVVRKDKEEKISIEEWKRRNRERLGS